MREHQVSQRREPSRAQKGKQMSMRSMKAVLLGIVFELFALVLAPDSSGEVVVVVGLVGVIVGVVGCLWPSEKQ